MQTGVGARNGANLAFRYSEGTFVGTRVCQTFVIYSHGRNYFVEVTRCRYS